MKPSTKLKKIMAIKDKKEKESELFSFLLKVLPHSPIWLEADKEWKKIKKELKK